MRRAGGWGTWAGAWLLPLLLSACAGAPRDASLPISDPSEAANRQVLAANQEILRPVSEAVKAFIPGPVHDRLHDLNSNLKEPRIFVNDVLQLRFDAAGRTAAALSSIPRSAWAGCWMWQAAKFRRRAAISAETLFVWGQRGRHWCDYLGPSTLRYGRSTVDMVANPVGWLIGSPWRPRR
jgi:phospholipid-binding lipoprotein MlaA